MKTVEYPNGYKGTWDDELKPGALITTYYKGFFELFSIEPRGKNGELVPLFHFILKFDIHGNPKKTKKIQCCDAAYCRAADIPGEIDKREEEISRLRKIKDIYYGDD